MNQVTERSNKLSFIVKKFEEIVKNEHKDNEVLTTHFTLYAILMTTCEWFLQH